MRHLDVKARPCEGIHADVNELKLGWIFISNPLWTHASEDTKHMRDEP